MTREAYALYASPGTTHATRNTTQVQVHIFFAAVAVTCQLLEVLWLIAPACLHAGTPSARPVQRRGILFDFLWLCLFACSRCSVMSCCPWGLAGTVGAMNCFFVAAAWQHVARVGRVSRVPAACGLGLGCFGLRVLQQVLCRTVRARGDYRPRQTHVALRTGGSTWRARRLVASQTPLSSSRDQLQRQSTTKRFKLVRECLACRSYAMLLFCETQNTPIKRPSDSATAFVVGWPLGRVTGQL